MRVALLGASHWHVPIYYLPALQAAPVELVALHDPERAVLERLDPEGSYPHYSEVGELLDRERPDLVFAHAPHDEMTALAGELVRRGQAFHMEKPAGVEWEVLQPVAEAARARGVFNSVAFVSRLLPGVQTLSRLREEGRFGVLAHCYFRLFAGPPDRYRDWGVDWMLDPARAGGGPLLNFGPHGVDLFLSFAAEPVVEVSAWSTQALHHERIEDLASVRVQTASGALGVIEVGYVLPGAYERYFSLTTDELHLGGSLEAGTVLLRSGEEVAFAGGDSDRSYADYVAEVLARFAAGQPARTDLGDAAAALRVLKAARESAATGRPVRLS